MDLFTDWQLLQRVDAALAALARANQVELPAGRNPRERQVRAAQVQALLHPIEVERSDRRPELPPALKELSDRLLSDAKTLACVRGVAGRWLPRFPSGLSCDELLHDVLRRLSTFAFRMPASGSHFEAAAPTPRGGVGCTCRSPN